MIFLVGKNALRKKRLDCLGKLDFYMFSTMFDSTIAQNQRKTWKCMRQNNYAELVNPKRFETIPEK